MVTEDAEAGYPGQELGRPATGPGSLAQPGRRMLSLLIDWLICLLIWNGFGQGPGSEAVRTLYVPLILLVENVLLISTAGATVGQRILGLRTETVAGGRLVLGAAVVRSVLLVLFLPVITLIWQRDHRGAHDMAAGAVVARTG